MQTRNDRQFKNDLLDDVDSWAMQHMVVVANRYRGNEGPPVPKRARPDPHDTFAEFRTKGESQPTQSCNQPQCSDLKEELFAYKQYVASSEDTDPLLFWRNNCLRYPTLSQVSSVYFTHSIAHQDNLNVIFRLVD